VYLTKLNKVTLSGCTDVEIWMQCKDKVSLLHFQEGVNYHYVDRDSMLEAIGRGEFIENAEFSGNPFWWRHTHNKVAITTLF